MPESRPPVPPFTRETALRKVQAAEDAWNTRDPHKVALAYTPDSVWRNRGTFVTGRDAIVRFLTGKWERELDYSLRKNLWTFGGNRIAVRFQYECRDHTGRWYRSYGNELWEFSPSGLMARREASINDVPIDESERRYFGPRPASEHGPGHSAVVAPANLATSRAGLGRHPARGGRPRKGPGDHARVAGRAGAHRPAIRE